MVHGCVGEVDQLVKGRLNLSRRRVTHERLTLTIHVHRNGDCGVLHENVPRVDAEPMRKLLLVVIELDLEGHVDQYLRDLVVPRLPRRGRRRRRG
eukprot:2405272-Prymnesium_polylepis.2